MTWLNQSFCSILQTTISYAAGRMFLLKKHAFPLWFRCANVLYPLCMLPLDALRKGRKAARYRWRMFKERWRHL